MTQRIYMYASGPLKLWSEIWYRTSFAVELGVVDREQRVVEQWAEEREHVHDLLRFPRGQADTLTHHLEQRNLLPGKRAISQECRPGPCSSKPD